MEWGRPDSQLFSRATETDDANPLSQLMISIIYRIFLTSADMVVEPIVALFGLAMPTETSRKRRAGPDRTVYQRKTSGVWSN